MITMATRCRVSDDTSAIRHGDAKPWRRYDMGMKTLSNLSTLVYSTDPSVRTQRDAPSPAPVDYSRLVPRLSYETKGRKGKGVTVLRDVPLPAVEVDALGKLLRTRCGSGGTTKDGVIEIQGDHRERVAQIVTERGWPLKRVGG